MTHRQQQRHSLRAFFARNLVPRVLFCALTSAGCGEAPASYLSPLDMSGSSGGGSTSGLPCDVSQALASACLSCHGSPPAGAPISLVTYADLTAAAPSDATKKVIEVAIARMQSSTNPMPPGGGATAADIKTLQDCLNAGLPMGSCGGTDGGTNPYNTPEVCTSGKTWTSGNRGSSSMNPGQACITCHSTNKDAPKFQIAGTVYPTAHEPNNCLGTSASSGVTVVITDAGGTVITLTPNSSGNFYYLPRTTTLKMPYHAQVKSGTTIRAMSAAQMNGDCNSCHTDAGANGAPGRIMAP